MARSKVLYKLVGKHTTSAVATGKLISFQTYTAAGIARSGDGEDIAIRLNGVKLRLDP